MNAWEQRKLGEVLSERNIQEVPTAQIPLVSFTVEQGVTPKTERYNREFLVREETKKYKYTKYNDIVYNPANLKFGAIARNKYGEAFFSPIYVTFEANYSNVLPEFIEKILTSNDFIQKALKFQEGTVYERMAVKADDFLKLVIKLPSVPEQAAIGSFFQELDQLITLQQRELELMKEGKKTLLSKMFPKDGENFPEIRFPSFTNAWEQRKLGEVSEKVKEKNSDNLYSSVLTNSAELGIIPQRDFFDKDIANEKSLNGYYIVKQDDFVYNPRISNHAPVGPIKRNRLNEVGVMSPLYYVFRTHNIENSYLATYFDATYWHKFMKLNGDSGARADRFAIKDSLFIEMPIPFPPLPEQTAIGSFFKELDQLITLQQRE